MQSLFSVDSPWDSIEVHSPFMKRHYRSDKVPRLVSVSHLCGGFMHVERTLWEKERGSETTELTLLNG